MDGPQAQFKEVPTSQIEGDVHQPRKDLKKVNLDRLAQSLEKRGMQQPLIVRQIGDENRYLVIDGHRRLQCAENLKLKTVPCIVHNSSLKDGELEVIRYEVQNNRMGWKPMERAGAFHRIKTTNHLKSDTAVGELLGLSGSTVGNYLNLRDATENIRDMMAKYDLSSSNRTEFLRVVPKLRKIRDLGPDHIIEILLEKKKQKVISNCKDLRKLSKVFLRAAVNENEIYEFLTIPEMTIEELASVTINTGNALLLDKIITLVTDKLQHGQKLPDEEEKLLMRLNELIEKYKKLKPATTS